MMFHVLFLTILFGWGQLGAMGPEKSTYKQPPTQTLSKSRDLPSTTEPAKRPLPTVPQTALPKSDLPGAPIPPKQEIDLTHKVLNSEDSKDSKLPKFAPEYRELIKKQYEEIKKAEEPKEPKWWQPKPILKVKNDAKEFYSKNKTKIRVAKAGLSILGFGFSMFGLSMKIIPMVSGSGKSSNIAEVNTGILSSSPYPNASQGDENYERKLLIIANKFNGIQDKFRQAIENSSYNDKVFKISVGAADLVTSTVEVEIDYDFKESGAGNIEMPFTPFTINLLPEQIDEFAINLESLVLQISSEETRNFVDKIIYPDAAFIFLIKYILHHLTTFKNAEIKDDTSQTVQALTQVPLLLYRYNLTPSKTPLSSQTISADLPESILDYIDQTTITMPDELIQYLNKYGSLQHFIDNGTRDLSLKMVLDSYIQYFLNIYNKKFSGDDEYIADNVMLGKYETLEQLIAIFIHSFKMISQAEQYLFSTTDKVVTLKTAKGSLAINPSKAFDSIVKPSAIRLAQAQKNLAAAVIKFRQKAIDLTKYEEAKAAVEKAAQDVAASSMKYRTMYTLYYPVNKNTNTSLTQKISDALTKPKNSGGKTIVDFLKGELKTLQKRGDREVLAMVKDIYELFKTNIGLPLSEIWQESAIDTNTSKQS